MPGNFSKIKKREGWRKFQKQSIFPCSFSCQQIFRIEFLKHVFAECYLKTKLYCKTQHHQTESIINSGKFTKGLNLLHKKQTKKYFPQVHSHSFCHSSHNYRSHCLLLWICGSFWQQKPMFKSLRMRNDCFVLSFSLGKSLHQNLKNTIK